jgi:hypothetical protein
MSRGTLVLGGLCLERNSPSANVVIPFFDCLTKKTQLRVEAGFIKLWGYFIVLI